MIVTNRIRRAALLALALGWAALAPQASLAEDGPLPDYLKDRGRGIPTSLFGSYVDQGELLFYPFYEYTTTGRFEYQPVELGTPGNTNDYLGELVEQEFLLFFAYGFSDRLAVEVESAVYAKGNFKKAPDDPSAVPNAIEESGLGDTEGQVRYRWREETPEKAEIVQFLEIVLPLQKDNVLIGTADWEGATGINWTKGYGFGTMTYKAGLAYDGDGGDFEIGEFGAQWLKRVSPRWRLVAALEGESDELSLIGEGQYTISRHAHLKLNTGIGLTAKAPDLAPEVGVMFSF